MPKKVLLIDEDLRWLWDVSLRLVEDSGMNVTAVPSESEAREQIRLSWGYDAIAIGNLAESDLRDLLRCFRRHGRPKTNLFVCTSDKETREMIANDGLCTHIAPHDAVPLVGWICVSLGFCKKQRATSG